MKNEKGQLLIDKGVITDLRKSHFEGSTGIETISSLLVVKGRQLEYLRGKYG